MATYRDLRVERGAYTPGERGAYTPGERGAKLVNEDLPGKTKTATGKPQLSLLPYVAEAAIAKAFEFGLKKYARDDWKQCDRQLYIDAAKRHVSKYASGELIDPESGLSHMAHAAASCMIVIWHEEND